jgi:hypothetical protein
MAVLYFSTLSHKRYALKNSLTKVCFLFYLQFKKLSMYIGLHVKCLLLVSYFDQTRIFPTDFWKNYKYNILLKYLKWEPSYMRTDGRGTWQS